MRINNRFCGYYCGRPLLEDSTVYTSIRALRDDYMCAIEEFDTYNLHTFPTVELDGVEYYAVRVYFENIDELLKSAQILPNVNVALCWNNGTTMYFLVRTEEDENALLSAIADLFDME